MRQTRGVRLCPLPREVGETPGRGRDAGDHGAGDQTREGPQDDLLRALSPGSRARRKVVSAGHGISDSSGLSVGGGACVAVRAWGWWCAAASVVTLCSLMEEERVRPCRDRESTV